MHTQFTAQDIHQLGRGYNNNSNTKTSSKLHESQTVTPNPEQQNPANPLQPHETGESLKTFLERLSPLGLTHINNRDFDSLHKNPYLHPNHLIYFDNYPQPMTCRENLAIQRKLAAEDPGYHLELKGIDSDIDERNGKATVHMEIEITGLGGTERMLGVSSVEWWRDGEGCWWCVRAVGMRGWEGGGGFV